MTECSFDVYCVHLLDMTSWSKGQRHGKQNTKTELNFIAECSITFRTKDTKQNTRTYSFLQYIYKHKRTENKVIINLPGKPFADVNERVRVYGFTTGTFRA